MNAKISEDHGGVAGVLGSTVGTCSSCTRSTARIRRRWTRKRVRCSSNGRRRPTRRIERGGGAGRRSRRSSAPSTSPQSIRRYGHCRPARSTRLAPPIGDPSLLPETHGVTNEDLRRLPATLVASPLCEGARTCWSGRGAPPLYCSTTGYDFAHVFVPEERDWLRQAVEPGRFRAPADPIDPVALLDRLTQVEAFERFLHRTFPGKTRFSIEGLDMLVPVLDEIIGDVGGGRHPAHPARDGAPRPPQRDGARAEQAVRADPRRVQGPGLGQASAKTWRGPAT